MKKVINFVKEHKEVIVAGAAIAFTAVIVIKVKDLGATGGPYIVVDDSVPGVAVMQKLLDTDNVKEVFVGIKDLEGHNYFFGTNDLTKEIAKGFKIIHV